MGNLPLLWILLLLTHLITGKHVSVAQGELLACKDSDREALLDFKKGLQDSENWLSSWKRSNCCCWWGIICDNTTGAVIAVDLRNPSDYDSFGSHRPGHNNFNSMLPNWIVNIRTLVFVGISSSGLYGRIPLGFSELPNLKSLDLNSNENLSASASQLFWGSRRKIEEIDFSINKLHGKLPASLGNTTSLIYLDLSNNVVKGGIPSSIERNSLQGPIPHSFGNLKCLSELRLETNKLSGSLPDSLGLRSELFALNVSSNEMSGVIPYTDHMMTSSASSFIGNPGLCGSPLTVKCLHGDPNYSVTTEADNANGFIDKWSCLSIGMGFAVSLLLPYLVFAIKRPWGDIYFSFSN
ncbi:hypothetical protein GH714_029920 [Hevea brasiliensis]|uniref:Leucine-rich repeat-containing N-terminal plant-type domain-containing protein n=1 Tax=Hevea brasiliensis TaxID=3981 RepID=A0A6A6N4T9_HEVBR|nr:hypothetical protein GH714_029920 [Hevea brasiliensis]